MSCSRSFNYSNGEFMIYDHVFPISDLPSLFCARKIQLETSDSILLLHPEPEIGMPTNSCGLFLSHEFIEKFSLDPIPPSVSISQSSPYSLRSEWLEKHLSILLALDGASISTRAILKITTSSSGTISGSAPISGNISFKQIHQIKTPSNLSNKWYGTIHTNPLEIMNKNSSCRNDQTYESWFNKRVDIPNTIEVRNGFGSESNPNTIDIILEIVESYFDKHIRTN